MGIVTPVHLPFGELADNNVMGQEHLHFKRHQNKEENVNVLVQLC